MDFLSSLLSCLVQLICGLRLYFFPFQRMALGPHGLLGRRAQPDAAPAARGETDSVTAQNRKTGVSPVKARPCRGNSAKQIAQVRSADCLLYSC